MKQPIVVGLNVGHDGGCAIIADGRITAVSEERITRTRYASGWISALFYCLSATGVVIDQVDRFVFSSVGRELPKGYTGGLESLGVDHSKVSVADHHLAHAFGAYCLSPFEEATVVVLDSGGNSRDTESWYAASGDLNRIGRNDQGRHRAGGIGPTYSAFGNFLGFDYQEAGKLMALAAYGDPNQDYPDLFSVNRCRVTSVLGSTHEAGVLELERKWGVSFGRMGQREADTVNLATAAWLQRETESAVRQVVSDAIEQTGLPNVCLSGGVALNCVANQVVRSLDSVAGLYVLPASSDRGQALGLALIGYRQLTGEILRVQGHSDAFGKEYSDAEILGALEREPTSLFRQRVPHRRFRWVRSNDAPAQAAALISSGNVIGWFDGGSELGPRALGGRSILADPRSDRVRQHINDKVKHREWYRPFAPSVLSECSDDWFEAGSESPHMLFAPRTRQSKKSLIPGVQHVDGTARVQTVDRHTRPRFRKLIEQFREITGVPMVLNTSFNDREPIVESPADALACFLATGIDVLFLGDFVVEKEAHSGQVHRDD